MGMKEGMGVVLLLVCIVGLVFWATPQDGGVAAVQRPSMAPADLIADIRTMAWAEEVDKGTHTTIAVPRATTASIGLPDNPSQGGAWLMNAGTTTAHIMTPGH